MGSLAHSFCTWAADSIACFTCIVVGTVMLPIFSPVFGEKIACSSLSPGVQAPLIKLWQKAISIYEPHDRGRFTQKETINQGSTLVKAPLTSFSLISREKSPPRGIVKLSLKQCCSNFFRGYFMPFRGKV